MAIQLTLLRLNELAIRNGFADYQSMLYDLYVMQGFSIENIANRFHVHQRRIRRHLTMYGIRIRSRGGPNYMRIVLTQSLIEEVLRDGIAAVAERLGVDGANLRQRLMQLHNAGHLFTVRNTESR